MLSDFGGTQTFHPQLYYDMCWFARWRCGLLPLLQEKAIPPLRGGIHSPAVLEYEPECGCSDNKMQSK